MKLTTRLGRRLAAGSGLAAAAILLPVAALASSAHPAAGHPAAHPAGTRPPAPPCTAAHTRVWYGEPGDGATGHVYYQLQFSNIGRSACSLYGYPGVSALAVRGGQVGLPATHSGPRLLVTLPPGGTAHVVLAETQAGFVCTHPVRTVDLRVYPPGQRRAQFVPFASAGCPGKSVLHVDAVHPHAGIPGYSIR